VNNISFVSFLNISRCGNTFVITKFSLLEVRLSDRELLIVTEHLLKRGVTGMRGGWGDYNTQMCKLHTKCVFISPLEVRDAELDDSCGSSETSCIIERADQLARVVVDWWCENIMSVDDLCESRFSRGEIDGPLLNVEHGIFDFLRGCFIPYREQLHGILAIKVARKGKIFDDNLTSWSTTTTQPPRNATDDDLRRISSWANQLQADIEQQNVKAVPPPIQPT